MGYVSQALKSSASYLPSGVTDVFNQGRAFANIKLPFSGLKNICALAMIQKLPRVLVASQDGYLYIYNLDPAEGGDCTLLKQHRLICDTSGEGFAEQGGDRPLTKPDYMESPDDGNCPTADLLGTAAHEDTLTDELKLDDDNEFPPMTHHTDIP